LFRFGGKTSAVFGGSSSGRAEGETVSGRAVSAVSRSISSLDSCSVTRAPQTEPFGQY
jgi:hypothetical protein